MSDAYTPQRSFAQLITEGVLEIGDGYRAKLNELGGTGPIFLRAGRLTEHGINWDGAEQFDGALVPKLVQKRGQPGDTMVTTKGNSIGRAGYVAAARPVVISGTYL